MDNPQEIIEIANIRLKEAKILLQNNHYSGAFYLAGYSVELYLKARICKIFGTDDLFSDTNKSDEGISDIRKAIKTHNLFVLLTFSGLKPIYKELKKTNQKMFQNASFIMKEWNEAERYRLANPVNHTKIENMLNNLEDFLQWINKS